MHMFGNQAMLQWAIFYCGNFAKSAFFGITAVAIVLWDIVESFVV